MLSAFGRAPSHQVESATYHGQHAVCVLLRQGPDTLNPAAQPHESSRRAIVACGYYELASGTAGRLEPPFANGNAGRLQHVLADGRPAALAQGDGVYAFASWDRECERLTAGVDKLGMRPLYWRALPGGGHAIASELKTLIALAPMPRTNWAALEEQLSFGFIFGDHTLFQGVDRFGIAEVIEFDRRGVRRAQSEDFLSGISVSDQSLETFVEEQHELFDRTMHRLSRLYDARESSMLTLSGGHDSRRVLAWMISRDIRPKAYTVPEVRPDGSEYESAIVAELCRSAGLDGQAIYPTSVLERLSVSDARDVSTDFQADEHGFSVMLAMAIAPTPRINFDGLAAGSQLSGSFVTPRLFRAGADDSFLSSLPRSARFWLSFPGEDTAPPLAQRVRAELSRWAGDPNRFAYFYLASRTRREIALAPLCIQANVFESLYPFLDRQMMRSALRFPPQLKIGAGLQGRLANKQCPLLANIPTIYSTGIAKDQRYCIRMGAIEHGARRATLKRAANARLQAACYPKGSRQQWRFQAARAVAAVGQGERRLRWEHAKAAKIDQLLNFERLGESTDRYIAAADDVARQYGTHAGWCQSLGDPGWRQCS